MKTTKHLLRKNGAALLIFACLLSLFTGCSKSADSSSQSVIASSTEETEVTEVPEVTEKTEEIEVPEETEVPEEEVKTASLQFPYQLESEKLVVASLFQFSGFNPDCNLEEGKDIASLFFTNTSDEHLTSAVFTVVLIDGTQFRFEAVDVPAGASVLAFATDNAVYDISIPCAAITCEAEFDSGDSLMKDAVSVSVEETSVTLTNLTDKDLTNLVIHFHTLFDGSYFGGLTYSYPAGTVAAGDTIVLQAEDCYLGEAVVVRITQDG